MPSFGIGTDDPPQEKLPHLDRYPLHNSNNNTISKRSGFISSVSRGNNTTTNNNNNNNNNNNSNTMEAIIPCMADNNVSSFCQSASTGVNLEVQQFFENTLVEVSRAMLKCSPDLLSIMSERNVLDDGPTQRALTEIYLLLYSYFKMKSIEYNKNKRLAISSLSADKLVRHVLMTNLIDGSMTKPYDIFTNTPCNPWYKTDHFPFIPKESLQEQLSLQKIHELINSKDVSSSRGPSYSTFDQVINLCYFLARCEAKDSRLRLYPTGASDHSQLSCCDMEEELKKLDKIKEMGYVNILHVVAIAFTLMPVPTCSGVGGLVKALLELTGVYETHTNVTVGAINKQTLPLSIALKILHLWSLLDTSRNKDLLQEFCEGVIYYVYNRIPLSNDRIDDHIEMKQWENQSMREYLNANGGRGADILRVMAMYEETPALDTHRQKNIVSNTNAALRGALSYTNVEGKMDNVKTTTEPDIVYHNVVYHSPTAGTVTSYQSLPSSDSIDCLGVRGSDEIVTNDSDFWTMLAS